MGLQVERTPPRFGRFALKFTVGDRSAIDEAWKEIP